MAALLISSNNWDVCARYIFLGLGTQEDSRVELQKQLL